MDAFDVAARERIAQVIATTAHVAADAIVVHVAAASVHVRVGIAVDDRRAGVRLLRNLRSSPLLNSTSDFSSAIGLPVTSLPTAEVNAYQVYLPAPPASWVEGPPNI